MMPAMEYASAGESGRRSSRVAIGSMTWQSEPMVRRIHAVRLTNGEPAAMTVCGQPVSQYDFAGHVDWLINVNASLQCTACAQGVRRREV